MPLAGFESGRVFGPDLARGIALLGMFAAHVVFDRSENFYDGRSSILFATVAGVSLGLLTGGSHPEPRGRRGSLRGGVALRGLALIVLGVFLTVVIQPPLQVILDYYGFAFLLLVPLLFSVRRVLALAAALVLAVMPALVHELVQRVEPADIPAVVQPFTHWLVFGTYPMAIWLAFPIAGLFCARSDLNRRRTQVLMIAGGVVAACAGYGAAALIPGVSARAHSGTVAEVIASGGVAIAIIGAATLVGSLPGRAGRGIRIALYPVAAAGGMALTLYTAQAMILAVVRQIVSGGADRWMYPEPTLAVLIVSALLIGTLWRRFLGPGPLEWLLKRISGLAAPRIPTAPADASKV
ncbi:MAG: hypothetical protein JWP32_2609 [Schumannella sp.]|nr:hypothetical protein [Schumannella sp.]